MSMSDDLVCGRILCFCSLPFLLLCSIVDSTWFVWLTSAFCRCFYECLYLECLLCVQCVFFASCCFFVAFLWFLLLFESRVLRFTSLVVLTAHFHGVECMLTTSDWPCRVYSCLCVVDFSCSACLLVLNYVLVLIFWFSFSAILRSVVVLFGP